MIRRVISKITSDNSFFNTWFGFGTNPRRTLFILLIVFFYLGSSVAWAIDQDAIDSSDGKAHVALSALGTVAIHSALRAKGLGKWEALLASIAAMTFIGVTKEITDNKVTESDLRADGYGIGLGASVVIVVDWF